MPNPGTRVRRYAALGSVIQRALAQKGLLFFLSATKRPQNFLYVSCAQEAPQPTKIEFTKQPLKKVTEIFDRAYVELMQILSPSQAGVAR